MKVKLLSHVQLFATPWTAAYQAPPSMGFARQEYWSGVPSPSLDLLKRERIKCSFDMDFFLLLFKKGAQTTISLNITVRISSV